MNTKTIATSGDVELNKLAAKFEAERKDKLRSLQNEREQAVQGLNKAEKIVTMWEGELSRIDRQIAAIQQDQPAEVSQPPVEGRRRSSDVKVAAMEAVYRKLCSEPGRKFKSSELDEIANGFKVRLLAYEWNQKLKDKMDPLNAKQRHLKPIESEGEYRHRFYFVKPQLAN